MISTLLATAVLAGSVQRLTMPAPALRQSRRDVRVYLPPSYFRAGEASRRYPVIYMLHGWPGSEGNWFGSGRAAQTADTLIASGLIPEVLLVCPDGDGRGLLGRSLYVNSYDGASRMEDFIVRDLVTWTDSVFRTRAEPTQRGIYGLSDGGTGAVNLAFRHPEVFGSCGSSSGEFALEKEFGMGGVVGPEPQASRLLAQNSPALYLERVAPRVRGMTIYLDCGTSDEALDDNRHFHAELLRFAIPHTYREFPGTHAWVYWRAHVAEALEALTAKMGALGQRIDATPPEDGLTETRQEAHPRRRSERP